MDLHAPSWAASPRLLGGPPRYEEQRCPFGRLLERNWFKCSFWCACLERHIFVIAITAQRSDEPLEGSPIASTRLREHSAMDVTDGYTDQNLSARQRD